jgi:hypothetical protein
MVGTLFAYMPHNSKRGYDILNKIVATYYTIPRARPSVSLQLPSVAVVKLISGYILIHIETNDGQESPSFITEEQRASMGSIREDREPGGERRR